MYIVNSLASKEEKDELLKSFKKLDTNGDGVLSKEELIAGYSETMDQVEAEEEVTKLMEQIDINNSGQIDYTGKKGDGVII